jgi:hypothetical protein
MIGQLSDELKRIIECEKQAGNKVVQVDRNWPRCGNINVLLDRRFMAEYSEVKGVKYSQDHDPHNPIEMYFDISTGDCVFCSTF